MLVKDQLAHRLLTNIHRGGCGHHEIVKIMLWWSCKIFHLIGMKETGTFTTLPQELKVHHVTLLLCHFHSPCILLTLACCNAVRSLLALSATCRQMHRLALDRLLWISLLQRDFWKSLSQNYCMHAVRILMFEYLGRAWADLFVLNSCTVNCSQLTLLVLSLGIVYWCQHAEPAFSFLELLRRVCAPCAAVGVAVYCARTQHVIDWVGVFLERLQSHSPQQLMGTCIAMLRLVPIT